MSRFSNVGGFACALITGVLVGCANFDAPATPLSQTPSQPAAATLKPGEISPNELDQLTNAFADNYVSQLASACEEIKLHTNDPRIIADADSLKLISATSVFDIVTGVDPFGQMLDLFVMISLQHLVWVDEGGAVRRFGPHGETVVAAIRDARAHMLELAARTMRPDQVELLSQQAREWRTQNPGISYVGFVRFTDAASARARAVAEDVRKGGGLLAPVSSVVDSLERSRKIAERGLYLAKRLPMLMGWQADDVVNGVMSRADVRNALDSLRSLGDALEKTQMQLDKVAALVPAERQIILEELRKQQAVLDQTILQIDRTITSGNALLQRAQETSASVSGVVEQAGKASASLQQSLADADKLLAHLERAGIISKDPQGIGRGFESLNTTADKLAAAALQLNQLTHSADSLLSSRDLASRLAQLDAIADQRLIQAQGSTERVARTIFNLVAGAIGLTLLAGLIYQTYASLLRRREKRAA